MEPVIAMLTDKEAEIRKAAAIVLGALCGFKATEPLIKALRDENPEAQKVCAGVLERLTGKHFRVNFKQWWEWLQGESEE